MSPSRALAAAFALALLASTPPLRGQRPVYEQRLQVPVAFDDIGYGQCVTADPHTGEVFVCDPRTNRILIFDPEGSFRYQILGGEIFSGVEDLAVDPEGLLVVLGALGPRRLLLELDFDGLFRRELPLTGLLADAAAPGLLSVALSPAGDRLYALDGIHQRLWIADRDGLVTGSVDLAAGLGEPERRDLILGRVDVYGDSVLVAIPSLGEIRRFDLDGRQLDQVGRKGASRCLLGRPTAAALTADGEFLVVDQQRMVLTRWRAEGNRCLGEAIGIGSRPGYLYYPHDLSLDLRGRLYIAQSFEGRVQVYSGMGSAAAEERVAVVEPLPAQPEPTEPRGPEPRPSAPRPAAPLPTEPLPTAPLPTAPLPTAPRPADEAAAVQPPLPAAEPTALARLVEGARASLGREVVYDASYAVLDYPGGDPGPGRGAAVDLVVRAFRGAGIDLQREIHEAIAADPAAWGAVRPDPNIDHRRIRNLETFFRRRLVSLPAGADADWLLGDVVLWDTRGDGRSDHLGLISAPAGPESEPLVVHHHRPDGEFDGRPGEDPVLFRWPITGHFRLTDAGFAAGAAEAPAAATPLGEAVVRAAREWADKAPRYDPAYVELAYPGGDPGPERGAGVDLVVRAFRGAGIDLQKEIHEDVRADGGAYGVDEPDPSIDHRRLRNLLTFAQRRMQSLPAAEGADWRAGDLVFWDTNGDGRADRVGVLSTGRGPSGRPAVLLHRAPGEGSEGRPAEEDVLFRWPVTGHFRWSD